jgi:hypothetical protein
MSLYQKIYDVMCETEGLEKNLQVGTGSSSYKAVGEAEVLNMLKPLFKKHKLIVFPVDGSISETNFSWETEYQGKKETKTRNVTQIVVKFKIVDIETGENEILIGFGNGADSQDKGSGKAFTYAFKTMLNKTFMLFSGEDTDNEHSEDIGKQTKIGSNNASQPKTLSDGQINRLFAIAKSKGYNAESVKKTIMQKYSATEVKNLSKAQYDEAVAGYENAPVKVEK